MDLSDLSANHDCHSAIRQLVARSLVDQCSSLGNVSHRFNFVLIPFHVAVFFWSSFHNFIKMANSGHLQKQHIIFLLIWERKILRKSLDH
jgi:hypothetical protein